MNRSQNRRTFDEDILARAAEDWVTPGEVYWSANSASGLVDSGLLRDLSIGLLARLILQGLVVPGDLKTEGFSPWKMSAGAAISRIAREWLAFDEPSAVYPGAVFWLQATPTGVEIGESVWEREGSPPLKTPRTAKPVQPLAVSE